MIIRKPGISDYVTTWRQMLEFTANRTGQTRDEIWLLEHFPVFTLGKAGKSRHILGQTGIPLVFSDRGGQVTYHGPGQLICYLLFDLARLKIGVKNFVAIIEESIIEFLAGFYITAHTKDRAPGVYINGKKVAAIGLRVKQGRAMHGFSLNLDLDLSPFCQINPCGYPNLEVTRLSDHNPDIGFDAAAAGLTYQLGRRLGKAVGAAEFI